MVRNQRRAAIAGQMVRNHSQGRNNPMSQLLLRGRVLTFIDAPKAIDDTASYSYFEDGAVLVENGKVAHGGEYATLARIAGAQAEIIDHRPHLILPGFIDTHLHFPQTQAIASYGAQLLE